MLEQLPDIGVTPDYGLQSGGDFRVKTVSFGDGYEQRRPDGLNTVKRKWALSWTLLDPIQKSTLMDFLVDKKGVHAFLWTVPDSLEEYRVVCKQMPSWTADAYNIYSVSAEFEQDFSV